MIYFALTFCSLLSVISADAPFAFNSKASLALYSCADLIHSTANVCSDPEAYYCFCSEPVALASLTGCMKLAAYYNDAGFSAAHHYCAAYFKSDITTQMWLGAYQNFTQYGSKVEDIANFNITQQVEVPVIVSKDKLAISLRAYDMFLGNYDRSFYYGIGMIGYWVLVMVVATVIHWTKWFFPGAYKRLTGPFVNRFRRYVTLPATFSRNKTNEQPFLKVLDALLPSRLESLIIFGFMIVVIALNACHYYFVRGDPLFATKKEAMLRYVADRTGITATVNIPLVILFAGRNNICQWITGWNYATFVAFHKWVARFVFTLVTIHAICFSVAYSIEGYYYEEMKEMFLICGTFATVAGGIMLVQGMLVLRRNSYEVFLLFHIALAVLFIAGGWVHVQELGYSVFFYVTTGLWGLDRLVRICRLCFFGCPKAEVALLANETLKVVVPRPKYWKPIPGGHAFLHFMRPTCFWQLHPFTFTTTSSVSAGPEDILNARENDKIVMYLKVKGGVTHGLYKYLVNHPGRTATIRVSLEGPYGEASQARIFDTAVFIAGGNGIPGLYSEIADLATKSANPKQRLKLHWVIRDYKSLTWFHDELLSLKDSKIECTVHVTQPQLSATEDQPNVVSRSSTELDENSGAMHENEKAKEDEKVIEKADLNSSVIEDIKSRLGHITFLEGRPSMAEVVKHEIEESNELIAFVACGHPLMVDELRYQIAHSLDDVHGKRVDFFEQLQVWA